MNQTAIAVPPLTDDSVPEEWTTLQERVRGLPDAVRVELEPALADALEQARFRGRVLSVAREALGRQRLDLELMRFDLDATRRERINRMAPGERAVPHPLDEQARSQT